MGFALKIKETRKILMLSQQEFALELGVSFGTINRWENEKHVPNYKGQRKIDECIKKHGLVEMFKL